MSEKPHAKSSEVSWQSNTLSGADSPGGKYKYYAHPRAIVPAQSWPSCTIRHKVSLFYPRFIDCLSLPSPLRANVPRDKAVYSEFLDDVADVH